MVNSARIPVHRCFFQVTDARLEFSETADGEGRVAVTLDTMDEAFGGTNSAGEVGGSLEACLLGGSLWIRKPPAISSDDT